MVKVSILIPCYNNADWISQSIESALAQTHPSKEVIVVDDGSTDDSLKVIQSFGDRIRWESGPNRGGNAARNRLLEMATGTWVQYLDADDALDPNKVTAQVSCIGDGVDAIYGAITVEHWKKGECSHRHVSRPDPNGDVYAHWLDWKLAQTGAVLWKTESLRLISGWNQSFPCCQDNEVCLRALKAGLVFKRSDDSGAIYRLWSAETVSHQDPRRLLNTKTALLEEMLAWLKKEGRLTEAHSEVAGKACFQLARSLAASDIPAAAEYVRIMRSKGMMRIDPTVAPAIYQILFKVFGFSMAERVARALR